MVLPWQDNLLENYFDQFCIYRSYLRLDISARTPRSNLPLLEYVRTVTEWMKEVWEHRCWCKLAPKQPFPYTSSHCYGNNKNKLVMFNLLLLQSTELRDERGERSGWDGVRLGECIPPSVASRCLLSRCLLSRELDVALVELDDPTMISWQ